MTKLRSQRRHILRTQTRLSRCSWAERWRHWPPLDASVERGWGMGSPLCFRERKSLPNRNEWKPTKRPTYRWRFRVRVRCRMPYRPKSPFASGWYIYINIKLSLQKVWTTVWIISGIIFSDNPLPRGLESKRDPEHPPSNGRITAKGLNHSSSIILLPRGSGIQEILATRLQMVSFVPLPAG